MIADAFVGDVEITDTNGRVRKVHVTHIDNETITGTTSEGRVHIPIADVNMARVRKESSNSNSRSTYNGGKPKQWDPYDGQWTATEVAGTIVLGAAAVVGRFLFDLHTGQWP